MNVASPQEVIRIGQLEIRYLLEGAATNGALAVFETPIPPSVRSNHLDDPTTLRDQFHNSRQPRLQPRA